LHAVFAAQNQEFSPRRRADGAAAGRETPQLCARPARGRVSQQRIGEYNIGDDAWEIDSLLKKFGVDPTSWW